MWYEDKNEIRNWSWNVNSVHGLKYRYLACDGANKYFSSDGMLWITAGSEMVPERNFQIFKFIIRTSIRNYLDLSNRRGTKDMIL